MDEIIAAISSILSNIVPWLLALIGGGFGLFKWLGGERKKTQSETSKNDAETLASLMKMVQDLLRSLVDQENQRLEYGRLQNENDSLVHRVDEQNRDRDREQEHVDVERASSANVRDSLSRQCAVIKAAYDARGERIQRLEFIIWELYNLVDSYRLRDNEPPIRRQIEVPTYGVTTP